MNLTIILSCSQQISIEYLINNIQDMLILKISKILLYCTPEDDISSLTSLFEVIVCVPDKDITNNFKQRNIAFYVEEDEMVLPIVENVFIYQDEIYLYLDIEFELKLIQQFQIKKVFSSNSNSDDKQLSVIMLNSKDITYYIIKNFHYNKQYYEY